MEYCVKQLNKKKKKTMKMCYFEGNKFIKNINN